MKSWNTSRLDMRQGREAELPTEELASRIISRGQGREEELKRETETGKIHTASLRRNNKLNFG